MKLTIASTLFPVLTILAAKLAAAQDEGQSSVRGLSTRRFTVAFEQNLVNPGVFYGTEIPNGNWVIATSIPNGVGKRVSIGLRAYDASAGVTEPNPAKPFEYIFETGQGFLDEETQSGIPKWAFDFEFDSDVGCPDTSTSCTPLSTFVYEIAADVNPTIKTTWVTFDPINVEFTSDHFFGRTTATEEDRIPLSLIPTDFLLFEDYIGTITGGEYHVVQNYYDYGKFPDPISAPFRLSNYTSGRLVDAEGIYDIILRIRARGSSDTGRHRMIRITLTYPNIRHICIH
ncbi:hypothetical protein MHU86_23078 [Fragilaria crotonensis]|nr:hypothetical protein MHU86_23078 [Fragilaria crotonensis]